MFVYNFYAILSLFSIFHIYVECETCDEGQIILNGIEFQKCKHELRFKHTHESTKGSVCRYSEALIDECFPHYEKCYSGEPLNELIKFWLREIIGMAYIYDVHLIVSSCDAFSSIFSKDELDEIQTEIPKEYTKDKKCEYNFDYNPLILPELNKLDEVMKCQNKCSNDSVIKDVKDRFDSCKPGAGKVRDDLLHEHHSNKYRLTCGNFIKFFKVCSPILDVCLSSVWKELIITEESYVMHLGVQDGLFGEDDSFKIRLCLPRWLYFQIHSPEVFRLSYFGIWGVTLCYSSYFKMIKNDNNPLFLV